MSNLTISTQGNIYVSIYIGLHKVWELSFPRCHNNTLSYYCQNRVKKARENAESIVKRFQSDGRISPSLAELKKAFERNW